jgi:hypothetical protein
LAQQDFLSIDEREALRKVVRYFKDHYRITSHDLANFSQMNIHALRNFMSGRDAGPKGEALNHLYKYVMQTFVDEAQVPPGLENEVHLLCARYSPSVPLWSGNLRSLFPDVHQDLVYPVPEQFIGHYVIYRRAAVGGDVVRALLVVEEGDPAPRFTNKYEDSLKRTRITRGFVFNTGSALQLLGHVAPFPTLKLITFDWNDDWGGERLYGLSISNDHRNRFFAARCVAVRIPPDKAATFAESDTGVFWLNEIDKRAWAEQFRDIADDLTNTVAENSVLFAE